MTEYTVGQQLYCDALNLMVLTVTKVGHVWVELDTPEYRFRIDDPKRTIRTKYSVYHAELDRDVIATRRHRRALQSTLTAFVRSPESLDAVPLETLQQVVYLLTNHQLLAEDPKNDSARFA